MTTCTIVTNWNGTGSRADPYRPKVCDDYPPRSWKDTSGTAGGVGSYNVQATLDDATYAALAADPNYFGKITLQVP